MPDKKFQDTQINPSKFIVTLLISLLSPGGSSVTIYSLTAKSSTLTQPRPGPTDHLTLKECPFVPEGTLTGLRVNHKRIQILKVSKCLARCGVRTHADFDVQRILSAPP